MARKSKKVDFVNVVDANRASTVIEEVPAVASYHAALYARLSDETEANRERATIETQMDLLRGYASEQDDMVVEKEYYDISFSGQNFERPGFQDMIQDMRAGKINCIIVKDLSRLGRNYVETGDYIERVFPFFNVRFIAVTDGYDSTKSGEELLMPIKNMINEMYVKDLTKKMKSGHRAMWQKGQYTGRSVPYGYRKENRYLVPDERAVSNVKKIYELFLAGNSRKEIARQMSKIDINPGAYKYVLYGKEIPEGLNKSWNPFSISSILKNPANIGTAIHNTHTVINGKQVKVPESEWIIIENNHEPIIDEDSFRKAQKIMEETTRKFHETHGANGFDHKRFNLLENRIVCADCGRVMGFRTEGTSHKNMTFRCKGYLYTHYRDCTMHKADAKVVYDTVFSTIKLHMKTCLDLEQVIVELNRRSDRMKRYDFYGKEVERVRRELEKTTSVKAGFFEDYKDGLIDDEQYTTMSERYASKIKELNVRLDEFLARQASFSKEYHIDEDWKTVVEQYISKRKLTKEMVEAFVKQVVVHEGGQLEIHLIYDDMLQNLQDIAEGEVSE